MTHYNLLRIFSINAILAKKQFVRVVVWAFPLRVGLSATSPRYAVAFPLQSLTWVKGFFTILRLHFDTRGFGCSPKLPAPRPARKSSPAFVRQPTLFKVVFYNIFYQ